MHQDLPTLESILSAFITPDAMQDKYAFASGGGHLVHGPEHIGDVGGHVFAHESHAFV